MKGKRTIFFLIFFIFLIVAYLSGVYLKEIDWSIVTSITLIFTLLAVIWYALEAAELRKETAKQTELSLRPFIIPVLAGIMPQKYELKNIGLGTALKIKMNNIPVVEKAGFIFAFDELDILSPNDQKLMTIRLGDTEQGDFWPAALMPRTAIRTFDFEIRYLNINGKQYQTKGKLGKGGIVIEKTI